MVCQAASTRSIPEMQKQQDTDSAARISRNSRRPSVTQVSCFQLPIIIMSAIPTIRDKCKSLTYRVS